MTPALDLVMWQVTAGFAVATALSWMVAFAVVLFVKRAGV